MAKKVIQKLNDNWELAAPEQGGQIELVQSDQVRSAEPAPAAVAPYTVGELLIVPLAEIHSNPYQPRAGADPAATAELAIDIYARGLEQFPIARAVNGHYELAFGHTRRAAFELLASAGLPDAGIAPDERFAVMPLYIHPLDDRQMFEWAVSENVKRRDLNAIEQASSMKVYMTQFGATSRQVGDLFGISDATVRGTVRLLNLPAEVQQMIASGQITQGVARKLITLVRIGPDGVTHLAESIAEGMDADRAIAGLMQNNKNVVTMWEAWRSSDDARAGPGLWLLGEECASDNLPALKPRDVDKALGVDLTDESRKKKITMTLAALTLGQRRPTSELIEALPDDADLIERIELLLRPPACIVCPFHVHVGRAHLCGFKACHDRKRTAWVAAELQQLAEQLGIPVYDAQADGKATVPVCTNTWERTYEAHKKLVERKSPALRLAAHVQDRQDLWTQSYLVRLIIVGDQAEKIVEKRKTEAASGQSEYQKQQELWKREKDRQNASRKFYKDRNVPALFAPAFNGMTNIAAMCGLLQQSMPKEGTKKAATLAKLREQLADKSLSGSLWDAQRKGPQALARHLNKVAVTWGVDLPADLVDVARTYEPVSTETAEKKRGGNG